MPQILEDLFVSHPCDLPADDLSKLAHALFGKLTEAFQSDVICKVLRCLAALVPKIPVFLFGKCMQFCEFLFLLLFTEIDALVWISIW